MIRPTREMMWMQIAKAAAMRGTCLRLNVGATVVCENRILSIGYNGAGAGEPHCEPGGLCDFKQPCIRAHHAEKNALEWVNWQDVEDPEGPLHGECVTIYTTASPCQACAQLIDFYEVDRVIFDQEFRDTKHLEKMSAEVYRLTSTGALFDWKKKVIIDDRES